MQHCTDLYCLNVFTWLYFSKKKKTVCNTNFQEIPLCQVSHSLFHCVLGGNWARVGGGSGGDGGDHNSTLCWLFPICWSFLDRRDRCWLQIPIRSEPRLILHEAGEVALNKMVSTQCACWNAMSVQSARLNRTNFTHFRRTVGLFRGSECILTCFFFFFIRCKLL